MHIKSANKDRVVTHVPKGIAGNFNFGSPRRSIGNLKFWESEDSIRPRKFPDPWNKESQKKTYTEFKRAHQKKSNSEYLRKANEKFGCKQAKNVENSETEYRQVYITIEKSRSGFADDMSEWSEAPNLHQIASASSLDTLSNLNMLSPSKSDECLEQVEYDDLSADMDTADNEDISKNEGSTRYEPAQETRRPEPRQCKHHRHHHHHHHHTHQDLAIHRIRRKTEDHNHCQLHGKRFRSTSLHGDFSPTLLPPSRGCTFFHENQFDDDDDEDEDEDEKDRPEERKDLYRRVFIEIVKPSEDFGFGK